MPPAGVASLPTSVIFVASPQYSSTAGPVISLLSIVQLQSVPTVSTTSSVQPSSVVHTKVYTPPAVKPSIVALPSVADDMLAVGEPAAHVQLPLPAAAIVKLAFSKQISLWSSPADAVGATVIATTFPS